MTAIFIVYHVSAKRVPLILWLANIHIKTHLWDLSTNLSKLNILLKLKNIVLYES